jgi:DTW domain-containing protein YfiP
LYLGTQKDSEKSKPVKGPLEIRDRKGKTLPLVRLKGIVLLDGNWKQSKTLWWRNPWLLKLNRLLLSPTENSRFGLLRKQPRARCLSTLEAGAESLMALGETKASEALIENFEAFLEKLRRPSSPTPTPSIAEAPPPITIILSELS